MMAIPIDRVEDNKDMQAWEYMTFDLTKPKKDIDGLNRLGRDGWEAVSMVSSWGCALPHQAAPALAVDVSARSPAVAGSGPCVRRRS